MLNDITLGAKVTLKKKPAWMKNFVINTKDMYIIHSISSDGKFVNILKPGENIPVFNSTIIPIALINLEVGVI